MSKVVERLRGLKNTVRPELAIGSVSLVAAMSPALDPSTTQARQQRPRLEALKPLAQQTIKQMVEQKPEEYYQGEIIIRTIKPHQGPPAIADPNNKQAQPEDIKFQIFPNPLIIARSKSANFNDLIGGLESGALVIGMSREETTPPQLNTSEKVFVPTCGQYIDTPNIKFYPASSTASIKRTVMSVLPTPGEPVLAPVIFPLNKDSGLEYSHATNYSTGSIYSDPSNPTCNLPIANQANIRF